MATSLSDLATKIAAAAPTSGAVFRTTVNPDGSLQVLRAPSATSGVWTVLYARVVYNVSSDTVFLSDGPGNDTNLAATTATAFVAGLN